MIDLVEWDQLMIQSAQELRSFWSYWVSHAADQLHQHAIKASAVTRVHQRRLQKTAFTPWHTYTAILVTIQRRGIFAFQIMQVRGSQKLFDLWRNSVLSASP